MQGTAQHWLMSWNTSSAELRLDKLSDIMENHKVTDAVCKFLRKSAPSSGCCCLTKITVMTETAMSVIAHMKIKVLKAEFGFRCHIYWFPSVYLYICFNFTAKALNYIFAKPSTPIVRVHPPQPHKILLTNCVYRFNMSITSHMEINLKSVLCSFK